MLWIGTETRGVFSYNAKTDELNNYLPDRLNPNALSDGNVSSLFVDRSGVLWVGTTNQGINKFDLYRKDFVHFTAIPNKENSLSGSTVSGLSSIDSDELWVGTRDGKGISRYVFNGNLVP